MMDISKYPVFTMTITQEKQMEGTVEMLMEVFIQNDSNINSIS